MIPPGSQGVTPTTQLAVFVFAITVGVLIVIANRWLIDRSQSE